MCGTSNGGSSRFCANCGLDLSTPPASYSGQTNYPPRPRRDWRLIAALVVASIVIVAIVMQDIGGSAILDPEHVMGSGNTEYRWKHHGTEYVLRTEISYSAYLSYRQDTVARHAHDVTEAVELSKTFVTSSSGVISNISQAFEQASADLDLTSEETVNLVLSFVQNIDYVEDEVSMLKDEYWRYPVETLYDRMGDCEDKAFLFASIMEAMEYDAVILFFDGHAAAGVACPGVQGTYYDHDGSEYFYCETTSPGWIVGMKPSEYGSAYIAQVE